jgi:hypothetical protein
MGTDRATLPLLTLALVAVVGCSPTVLIIHTDPPGADVQDRRLGLIGQTPLLHEFSSVELERLGDGLQLDLDISKRDCVPDRGVQVTLRRGEEFKIKRELAQRLKYIDITSEPDGVAIFHVFVDPKARDYLAIKNEAPDRLAQSRPEAVIKRFLGNSPLRYQDDSEQPIEQDALILFEKAGYQNSVLRFKSTEKRLHVVMQPVRVQER